MTENPRQKIIEMRSDDGTVIVLGGAEKIVVYDSLGNRVNDIHQSARIQEANLLCIPQLLYEAWEKLQHEFDAQRRETMAAQTAASVSPVPSILTPP